jgi:DNA-directed RNA polymerase specialized sigma subunit
MLRTMKKDKNESNMTQQEVAKALGIGRGLVAHIERMAIKKLRKELEKRNIDPKILFKD